MQISIFTREDLLHFFSITTWEDLKMFQSRQASVTPEQNQQHHFPIMIMMVFSIFILLKKMAIYFTGIRVKVHLKM